MVRVVPVRTRKALKAFIELPNRLYAGDPNYVPGLHIREKAIFDRTKNPFFKNSEAEFFLALDGGRPVGRVAAIRNGPHLDRTGDRTGFFGFFESVEDDGIARRLLDAAVGWLSERGMAAVIGPENYTTNEVCGVLVEGFHDPPVFMMPYNKSWVPGFFERYGFIRELDLVSYRIRRGLATSLERAAIARRRWEDRLARREITLRALDLRRFDAEVENLRVAYNLAFRDNWGFVPFMPEEFRCQAADLRKITGPEMMLLAEHRGEIVGFLCALPDLNQVLIKLRNGRLFPLGILRLIRGRRRINRARILILGVIPEYRGLGIDFCLYARLYELLISRGYIEAEAAYVMENNAEMNKILVKLDGQISKRYRLYRLDFTSAKGEIG